MTTHTFITQSKIKLYFQDEGDPTHPAIILIMGLGAQMTVWPDELYYGLVSKGYRVIRFDNRDVGLSSHLHDLPTPNILKIWLQRKLNITQAVPYKLDDMAQDTIELLTFLKIVKVHVVGASMGGMIAQILATKYKKQVASITSMMSAMDVADLSPKAYKIALQLAAGKLDHTQQSAINYIVRLNQLIGSPAYQQSEHTLYQHAAFNYNRAHNPNGLKRQLAAIAVSQNRVTSLSKLSLPTLVIHGTEDPIFPLSAAKKTASAIKSAQLRVVNGLGHDFPPVLMPKIAYWIDKHIQQISL